MAEVVEPKFTLARGASADLPEIEDGQMLFTNDTEKLFIDYGSANSKKRVIVNPNPDWKASSGNGAILNKPNTISGYGISDAKIQNGSVVLGNSSITPVPTDGSTLTAQQKTNAKTSLGISASVSNHVLSLHL